MRLGAQKNGAADVKSHPWFEGFDWNAFQKLELPPPYIPKVHFLHVCATAAFTDIFFITSVTC